MDIAEVAKASGLPASTLRYYEERGLIKAHSRRGQRRQFGTKILEQLELIALGRSAGFSLDEIAQAFTPTGPLINRVLLLEKANALERKIKELAAIRDTLRHVAACRAPNHFECPKFLRLMHLAGKSCFKPANNLPGKR